METTLHKLD